jgi:hypothetical protein
MTDSFTDVHMWSTEMLSNKKGKYLKYRLIQYLSVCQPRRLRYVITGPEIQQSKETSNSRHVK